VILLLPILVLGAGLAVFLPAPVDAEARILQHALSLLVQIAAAATTAALLSGAARLYAPRDHERRVWQLIAAATGSWMVGLVVYAGLEWFGPGRPYPSSADGFLVLAFLLLFAALVSEFRLVNRMLTGRQRLALLGVGAVLWIAVVGGFMWPLLLAPLDAAEKGLDLVYASTVALLLPLALGPAVAFRGGAAGYVWLGVALGVGALALAALGFAYLTSFDLYSDVHPVNLLRIVGLAGLGASAAWHRRMLEAV